MLRGDTTDGADISGVLNQAPSTFPARSTEHLQFRIRVTGRNTGGVTLTLDQTNIACGSSDGMYASSVSITVKR